MWVSDIYVKVAKDGPLKNDRLFVMFYKQIDNCILSSTTVTPYTKDSRLLGLNA